MMPGGLDLERMVVTEIVELGELTIPELILRIARNPDDEVVKDRIRIATRDLRRDGLVRYRDDDEIVTPTRAAVRGYELFTGP
jgi:hypothetical protein